MEHNRLPTTAQHEEPPTAQPQVMPSALAAKIALAMRYTRTVPQDGYNGYDKYRYPKNATVLEYCGKGMAEAGLAIIPIMIAHTITQEGKTYTCQVEIDFHIMGDPGDAFVARWAGYGESLRTPAMCLKVAITNCHVSFVSKLFMLGADDSGETEAEDNKGRKPRYQPSTNGAGNGEYPKGWAGPMDAQNWLKSIGASADEARAAWVEAVRGCGSYSEQNKAQVFSAFYAANKPTHEQTHENGDQS